MKKVAKTILSIASFGVILGPKKSYCVSFARSRIHTALAFFGSPPAGFRPLAKMTTLFIGLAFLIFSLEVCAEVIPGSRISPSLKTETFPKIAVVQIERVLGEFRGKLKDQFSKYLDTYYKEFSIHEEKLREEHRGLLDQQNKIKKEDQKAKEAWAAKMREFETRVLDIQKIGEEKRHKLEQQYNQIIEKIYQELRKILKDLAHEKDIKLFIKDQHALHWDQGLDITDIVYKRLKGRIAQQDLIMKESING